MYTKEDVLQYVEEEGVRFIRLTYFDVFGVQKNVSIPPHRLKRAFEVGVTIDSTAVDGFENPVNTDLLLVPDPKTTMIMPWRSGNGNVIFMICDVYLPNGEKLPWEPRHLLKKAVDKARGYGLELEMAAKFEFYLFLLDEQGRPTRIALDQAGYMDVSPLDGGENVRRDICLTLEEMGLTPHKSFHQEGPGQNEVDFHFANALRAADEASIFKWVVRTIAHVNGLWADFSPRPMEGHPGNGMHIQLRFFEGKPELLEAFMAGILKYVKELTLFFNPERISYTRFGRYKAPEAVVWSETNRFCLMRKTVQNPDAFELRSPDCLCSPYLAFALMIEAGLAGIEEGLKLPEPAEARHDKTDRLPDSLKEAISIARASSFVSEVVPEELIAVYEKAGLQII